MRESRPNWLDLAPGLLALVLAVVSVFWANSNRAKQQDLADNQQKIAKAQAVANVSKGLVELLARTATETNDQQIRTLLARNGVTLNAPAQAAPSSTSSDAAGTKP